LKRYLIIILFIGILALAIYIGLNNGHTEHYDDGEISFNYPQSWHLKPGSNPSEIALFQPSPNVKVTVNKQVIPPGYKPPLNYIINTTEAYDSGFRLLSHQVTNLNNNTAYENTYYISNQGKIFLQKEIWIPKNGNLYSIIYTYQQSSLNPLNSSQLNQKQINQNLGLNMEDDQKQISENLTEVNYFDFKSTLTQEDTNQGFQIILENFDVYSVLKPAKTQYWADVSIPAIKVDWGVRADTVNAYNAVYHYKESFYPAENGTMGLLGHHTIYSAPFARIDQLKSGETVIINDYLTQKKYIYQVTSNGDIKWDYLQNPIKFSQGITDLTLVTCYPPGTTDAAWMVHCKLIKIETL
jgi:sortase A